MFASRSICLPQGLYVCLKDYMFAPRTIYLPAPSCLLRLLLKELSDQRLYVCLLLVEQFDQGLFV